MTARGPARRAVRPVRTNAQSACGSVQALARVRLASCRSRQEFEQDLRSIPAVRSAVRVIGDVDYELRLECSDLPQLGAVLTRLRACRGIEVASTALVVGDVVGLRRRTLSVPDWGTPSRPRQPRSA